jgi:PAS domain S-box-containing protein
MSEYHRLLNRQIKKHFGDDPPAGLTPFLEAVSQSYEHYQSDRNLIERAMNISSAELTQSNRKLLDESKRHKLLIESLKDSIKSISPDARNIEDDDLLQMADVLQEEIITRKTTEKLIAISEEKYRNIIENMELGMVETSLDGKLITVFDEFCKITGYTREELLGMDPELLLLDAEWRPQMERHRADRKKGEFGVYEIPIRTKSGEVKWVIISAAPTFDANKNVTGSVAIHFDITHRKEIEAALEKARIEAEASLKSKELFLANISHEIRTPMNAILGMSRLINGTKLDKTQRQYNQAIQASADGLMVIINDVLDMSKIKSGKFTVENISFNVDQVLDQMIKSLTFKAEEKGIYFHCTRDEQVHPFLIGDPTRLNQVLTNLASNAVKFTEKGGVEIVVSLVESTDKQDKVKFEVSDTGVGIDKEKFDTIFESFTQEDETITRKFGGTGLGLAISRQLVDIFEGELTVKSNKGKGSTFSFTLDMEHGEAFETEQVKVIGDQDLTDCKILLVEDNEINSYLAITILKKWNATVETAKNGLKAIEKLEQMEFDVIIMDMQMPKMDGVQATAHARNVLKLKVPIIALTANAAKGEKEKCIEAGMDDYISKPFEPDELFSKISGHWRGFQDSLMPMGDSDRFSLLKLRAMYNDNHAFVQKTVNIFLSQFEKDVGALREKLADKDFRNVKLLAHKIKPNIDLFQIEELHGPIREIEKKAEEENPEALAALVDNLAQVYTEVATEMRQIIDKS